MTISADVREAWQQFVFDDPTVVEPVTFQDLRPTLIDADVVGLYYGRLINFIQCLVTSYEQIGITGTASTFVQVQLSYWKEGEENDQAYLDVIDGLERIRALVRASLGISWGGVVEYYQSQQSPPDIVLLQIAGRPVWRGREVYLGTKLSTE